MKKAALLFVLIFIFGKSFSQNIFPATGSVGVGTTSPSAILHVNPSLSAASAIKIGAPNTSGDINVPKYASTGGYNIDFYTWRDIYRDQIGARMRAERINIYQDNNALVQGADLAFFTSNGMDAGSLAERMRISWNGTVSIGVKDAKGYMLAVGGSMIAESVKVKLQGAWPDFIFAKDYKLPTLAETEKHIKEKGHLPGIPSAAEVEKNGIELGEINKKLLQKIEELTLYLIEMKKEYDLKNSNMEKEIDILKSRL